MSIIIKCPAQGEGGSEVQVGQQSYVSAALPVDTKAIVDKNVPLNIISFRDVLNSHDDLLIEVAIMREGYQIFHFIPR